MRRQYTPIQDFIEAHRNPITGKRLIGRDALYAAVREGRCPHVVVGRRILIPEDALDRMADAQAAGLHDQEVA